MMLGDLAATQQQPPHEIDMHNIKRLENGTA